LQIFVEKPQALCTEIVLQDSDNKVYFHYLVQDTPGARGGWCTRGRDALGHNPAGTVTWQAVARSCGGDAA
jgi:hypothetical protein